jgi:protein involved in polysaccharide export with SLBB domain
MDACELHMNVLKCALPLLIAISPVTALAQKTSDALQQATRVQLQAKLAQLNSDLTRAKAEQLLILQEQASIIRGRLHKGDFQVGDRFVIVLRQDTVRSDTLIVRDSLRVAVLNLPEFSVFGVLRSELEEKLSAHVGRFLRNAAVRATLLTRVSVTGAVERPGFYYAGPDRPINDLLTSAGGPAVEADLSRMTVSRVGKKILSGNAAKRAVEDGSTLEALNIQSGDTVHVPLKRKLNWQLIIQLSFITMSLLFAMLQFIQWYYGRDQA